MSSIRRIVMNCVHILHRDLSSYYRGPDIQQSFVYYHPNTSVLKIIEGALKRNGDDLLLINGDTDEKVSSAKLLQQSNRIASGLHWAGVSPGDVVVLCCGKSILAYSLLLGVMFTGATAVLTPPTHTDKLDEVTSGHHVKALFYESMFSEAVRQSVAGMPFPPSLMGTIDLTDPTIMSFLNSTQEFSVFQVDDVTQHVPLVFFSSGTIGHPIGIKLSDRSVQMAGIYLHRKLKSLLYTMPLYWYSSLCIFLNAIFNRYPMIFTNTIHASHRLKLIEKYKVQSIFCNMAHIIQWVKGSIMYENFDLSSVTFVMLGGEPVLPSVTRQFFTKVLRGRASILNIFGCTEAGMVSSVEVRDIEDIQLGQGGTPLPGVEIKILDDNGHIVQVGVKGRICVKNLATKGYWSRDDLNRNFLDSEGFYDTGDAGFFDVRGNLYLRGRFCDFINFRGIKHSHTNLEDLLMTHPAVQDVAVVGKPHPSDIQHATAFVVLVPEYQGVVTDRDIVAFVDDRVEDSLRLRGGVNFERSLPRVYSGKVIRKFLKMIN